MVTVSTESYALIHELLALGIERFTSDDEVLVEITSKLETLLINENANKSKDQMKESTDQLAARTQAVSWKKDLRSLSKAKEAVVDVVDKYISAIEKASGNRGSKTDKGLKWERQMHDQATAAVLELGNRVAETEKARKALV